jgi:hypothetical protein
MSRPLRGLGVVALLVGCGGANAGQSDPQACAPVEQPASEVGTTGLEGAYTVRLVATSGAKRGALADGRLELMAQDSAHRAMGASGEVSDTTFSYPLYGTAEVDFAAVGATLPGTASSADPGSPGVLVIQRPTGVMLRFGSDANRAGMRRFDGGYTVFHVQQVTDEGFAGTWRSGVGLEESGGHFCAVRTT